MMEEEEPVKVEITFQLPEHRDDLQFALDGGKWWMVVWAIDQELRSIYKYGSVSDETADKVEKLRDFIREKCSEYNLTLDQ